MALGGGNQHDHNDRRPQAATRRLLRRRSRGSALGLRQAKGGRGRGETARAESLSFLPSHTLVRLLNVVLVMEDARVNHTILYCTYMHHMYTPSVYNKVKERAYLRSRLLEHLLHSVVFSHQ